MPSLRRHKLTPLERVLASPRLTCRDKEVLFTIGRLRLVTPRLLAEVFLPCYPEASALVIIRRRLKVLLDLGLIDRWRPRLAPGKGTAEYVILLTSLGKEFLQFFSGYTCRIGSPSQPLGIVQSTMHTYEVSTRLYLPILRATRQRQLQLREYAVEDGLHCPDVPACNKPRIRLFPDLTLKLGTPDDESDFYLCFEWDRGTMTVKQLLQKLDRYDRFCRTTRWAPVCAFVTTSWHRVLTVAKAITHCSPPLQVPWHLTAIEDFERNPLGRIWVRPGALDTAVPLPV
jgi:hypothetical protein